MARAALRPNFAWRLFDKKRRTAKMNGGIRQNSARYKEWRHSRLFDGCLISASSEIANLNQFARGVFGCGVRPVDAARGVIIFLAIFQSVSPGRVAR
jgi:hypothetical protein